MQSFSKSTRNTRNIRTVLVTSNQQFQRQSVAPLSSSSSSPKSNCNNIENSQHTLKTGNTSTSSAVTASQTHHFVRQTKSNRNTNPLTRNTLLGFSMLYKLLVFIVARLRRRCIRLAAFLLFNIVLACATAAIVTASLQNGERSQHDVQHQHQQKSHQNHEELSVLVRAGISTDSDNDSPSSRGSNKTNEIENDPKIDTRSFQSISFNKSRVIRLPENYDNGVSNDPATNLLDVKAAVDSAPTCNSAIRGRADWLNEPLPDICSQIMAFPQPYRKNCTHDEHVPGTPKCDPNRPRMFAQYGEDYFLYTRHFVHMKKPGVYLDVATNNPISISNTYFMDRCLGWSGICVEANSKYFEPIHRERSCGLVPTCISANEGETVEFMLSGPGSGIVSTHRHGAKVLEEKEKKHLERKKCVTAKSTLKRYGVTDIDYFNLDVEGGELNVLKGIDWDVTRIKVISVEISVASEQKIHDFLTEKGFVKIDTLAEVNGIPGMPIYPSNRFYVHSSGVFGQPW